MNHIYKVIFNHELGVWQCVSEIAKACGKRSSKAVKASVVAVAVAGSMGAMADDGIIDQDHTFTQSYSYADDIQIAPKRDQNVTLQLNNGLSLHMTANTTNTKFIHVGQSGQGTLNVNNANVISNDGIILGSNILTDTINGITTKTHSQGTVNLSNNAKLTATNYLMVGDGGHGTLNISSGATATAGTLLVANSTDAANTVTVDGAGSTLSAKQIFIAGSNNDDDDYGQATINLRNQATLKLTEQGTDTNPKFIGVGMTGQGTLNIDNSSAISLDSIILGVKSKTDTLNGVTTTTHSQGTVNLSNNANLSAQKYLMVGDGGHGVLNVNSGSFVSAKTIHVANETNSTTPSKIVIDGQGQSNRKSQVHAHDNITIGDEGAGTVEIKNDGTISTKRLILGEKGTGTLDVSSGGNVIVNNIERGSGRANITLNGADIKVEHGNQNEFFKGFTSADKIKILGNLEFNTNDHDVVINPNAVFEGNFGRFNISQGGGFEKTGKGTLTISENTYKNTTGDIAISEGTLKLDGDFKFNAGESLNIAVREANNYGKFHVTGNLDISKGALNLYASDVVKTLIGTPDASLTLNEMVKAGTLTGKFTALKVMDNKGNAINSTLNPEYTATAVNLTIKPTAEIKPDPITPIGVKDVGTNTFTHTGDFIMQQGDEIRVRLENKDTYGKLNITGKANFTQGHLSVQASDVVRELVKSSSTDWKNVITTGGRTGEFGQFDVVDNTGKTIFPSTIKPVYDGNNVHLSATATNPPAPPAPPAPAPKPIFTAKAEQISAPTQSLAVAKQLDTIVASSPTSELARTLTITQSILADETDKETFRTQVVEQLNPVITTQSTQLVSEQQNVATATVTDRIFQTRSDISQGSDNDGYSLFKRSQDLSNQVWIQGTGQTHKADTTAKSAGYKGNSSGVVIGADGLVSDNLRVGVALGYSNSDIDSKTVNAQNLKSKMLQGFVYGDYAYGDGLSVNGFVGLGKANIETARSINIINVLTGKANADYDSKTAQFGVGVDYRIGTSASDHISPYAQVRYTRTSTDGYTETVSSNDIASMAIKAGKYSTGTWTGTLGAHFAKPLNPRLTAIGHLAGQLESHDDKALNTTFVGASDVVFAQEAPKKDRYATQLGLGLRYQPAVNTEISGQYQGQFSKNTDNHGIAMLFKYKF